MAVTDVGMEIEEREGQELKASLLMLITEVGIVMEIRALQLAKAPYPIPVTVVGIETVMMEEHA